MSSNPLLSIVIPTRNEAANVQPLLEALDSALDAIDYELCFVDDSDDQTTEAIEKTSAQIGIKQVTCQHRQPERREGGLSTAVVVGLGMARGTFVCVIDADLQHPPKTIPLMLASAQAGADLVVASRYVAGGSKEGLATGKRHLVSLLARKISQFLFREAQKSTDPLSGFFLCRRALIDGIEFRPIGFKILLELLVCVPDLKVTDVPLEFSARHSGKSKATAHQGKLFLQHLQSLFFNVPGTARRIKFGLVGSSGLLIFSLLLAIFIYLIKLPISISFVPAFFVSLSWNTLLNYYFTFADQRFNRNTIYLQNYLTNAILGGVFMFIAFSLLTSRNISPILAGISASIIAMAVNGFTNLRTVDIKPLSFAQIAINEGVQAGLVKLAQQIQVNRCYLLPPSQTNNRPEVRRHAIPQDLLYRITVLRQPTIWIEATSHRHQRRSNIDLHARILLPAVKQNQVVAIVVCERYSAHTFTLEEFGQAIRITEELAEVISVSAPNLAPPVA